MDRNNIIKLNTIALRREYIRQVASRDRKKSMFLSVNRDVLVSVAERLKSTRLASLYVESQFHHMPTAWCLEKFGTPYPPVNVVFGDNGENWRRYEEYINGRK